MRLTILFFNIFLQTAVLLGQPRSNCGIIYRHVDTEPKYGTGNLELANFATKKLAPIIADSIDKENDELASSLKIVLTINKSGQVIGVSIPTGDLNLTCKLKLKQKLLNMRGWTSGKISGKPVCSQFTFPLSCLKWDTIN